jgi:hypothetical protein
MMRITSVDTDKNSNLSCCAWATVAAGHVLSISEEMGREGGELWSKSCPHPDADGGMPAVMASLARRFPYFYARVATAAWRDHLSPLSLIKTRHTAHDINHLKGEIEGLETEIREKKRKIRKIRCIS